MFNRAKADLYQAITMFMIRKDILGMPKIYDVAKLANVSIATVSRVITNAHPVTERTKSKVLKAIEELNYQPNISARHLRRMETNLILVVVPDITNSFFSRVLRGIEYQAANNGYEVLLVDTENNIERENKYLNILRQKQADGAILLTARMNKDVLEGIASEYPVVLACEYLEGSKIPTISIDNISSARKATEHLINLGHRRIACICGPSHIVLGRDRLKGYQQAMNQHEIRIDSVLVQEGDFSFESGYNLMMKFLALENAPTAVFAASDEMALGVIKAAKEYGFNVPNEISVVGFDDIKFASIFEPSLTTVSQPAFEMGVKAAEMLVKLMNTENLMRRQIVMEDKLIIRESCGAYIADCNERGGQIN
jgi:LacI family repressor for deo operon, udp, cdd, tsx, nupC, and nupG